MKYKIIVQPAAIKALNEISDRRIQEKIRDRIDGLAHDPEKQGKLLVGEFKGFRSIRAAGQRYRIIYRVEKSKVLVLVVGLGIRKEGDRTDVYALARRLIRLRLI